MDQEYKPTNQEKDDLYNREPGVVIIPGSNYAKEMQRFEQFPSKYGQKPGNPHQHREFPKMLYRAELWGGKALCGAAPPDPVEFAVDREWERATEKAQKFTQACQRKVEDEQEMSRAMEDNWRESPEAAVACLQGKERDRANEAAARNYEDRKMSPAALAEKKQALEEAGEHVPEGKVATPVRRRGRPKGSKNKPKH